MYQQINVSQTQLSQIIKRAISVCWLLLVSFIALTFWLVWVNDYHLMLVPQLVRAKLPTAIIGLFLHVSFPTSEIFRCLSVREYLLRGMLSADLIGFQTANYARHFRQTVSRVLALETLPKGIQLDNHFIDVGVFPVGIDVRAPKEKKQVIFPFNRSPMTLFNGKLDRRDPEVTQWVQTLTERYAGVKLVVGRDKLDEVQVGTSVP